MWWRCWRIWIRRPRSASQITLGTGCRKNSERFRDCSKGEFETELRCERDADGGAGTKKVAECTGRYAQLFVTLDGSRLRAGRTVETEGGGVGKVVHRHGKRGNIADEVVAGILAVEEVKKFG